MPNTIVKSKKSDHYFSRKDLALLFYLLMLTAFFSLLELGCLLIFHKRYVNLHSLSQHISVPFKANQDILLFIGTQAFVHLSYTFFIFAMTLLVALTCRCSLAARNKLGICLWFLGIMTILMANQYFFPNSRFSALTQTFLPDRLIGILLLLLGCLWAGVTILASFSLIKGFIQLWRRTSFRLSVSIGALMMLIAIANLIYSHFFYLTLDAGSKEKPNIIIIGVDSLRPDFLNQEDLPFFKDFLHHATTFTRAFTPLAKTFPAWMSLLSGKYPKETGLRFDLMGKEAIDPSILLSSILRQHHYKTIFASDEVRFSNIDQQYGFDEVVSPPMGMNDFILGSANDFPLSNLIINTSMGQWLFPYSYANRAAYVTYDPNSFLSLLGPYLRKARSQPLFLAVHFCLPHYPYLAASYSGALNGHDVINSYQASLRQANQQVQEFMSMLTRYGVLQHAIVVLISDHGEAFELSGDRITSPQHFVSNDKVSRIPRFYPLSADIEEVNQSAGHGSDVLSFSQYNSVLAIRLFGLEKQTTKTIPEYVTLLDIKPTLLDFLGLPDEESSGISLRPAILNKSYKINRQQGLFLESDYSPQALRSACPNIHNVVLQAIGLYTVDPQTTRVLLRKDANAFIMSSKQYAYLDGDWILALYPQMQGQMTPVLVNLKTGQWTTGFDSSFAKKSPYKHLLSELKRFFGSDIKTIKA